MALFDAFTGNAQTTAQQNAGNFLQDIRGETAQEIGQGLTTGLGMLNLGMQPSLDAINQGLNYGQNYLYGGAAGAKADLSQSLQSAMNSLGWGYGEAVGAANTGRSNILSDWAPVEALADLYGGERAGASALSRSGLGIDDPSLARARFQTSPGYEFMLGEGLESIARNANAAGMVASGNQMRESQKYGSGLADKEWDDWMNRLFAREQLYAPLEQQGTLARAQGMSQADLALAQMLAGAGLTTAGRQADLFGTTGRALADIDRMTGRDLATLADTKAGREVNLWGGLGSQAQADFLAKLLGLKTQANVGLAGGQAQTMVGAGDAEAQASKNFADTLLGLGKLITGSGSLSGLSNSLSGLFK